MEGEANTTDEKAEKGTKKMNYWFFSTIALLVVLGIFIVFSLTSSPTGMATGIGAQEAAEKAITWISSFYESEGADVDITLVSASETESGIYEFTIELSGSAGSGEVTYYVSKDGKLFFPQGFETEDLISSDEIPKTEKPEAHAFIMSYCPYGLQFLKAYVPVIELLGDKADLEVNFVHYLMHGEQEMTENTRMYCIQKEQEDKFTDYLRCFVESGDSASCIDEAGIDSAALDSCMADADEQFQITKTFEESTSSYPPYPVDAVLANQFSVSGSPTFVVNGQTLSVTRSAEAIKEAVCSAFIDPPAECEQTLNSNSESSGFGPIGSGSGASSSGQC